MNLALETQPPAEIPEPLRSELVAENRVQMARRARFGVSVLVLFNLLFAIADSAVAPDHLVGLYTWKAVSVGILLAIGARLRGSRGDERVALLSVLGASSVYVVLAIQSAIIGDYVSFLFPLVMMGLMSAGVMPWGTGAQGLTSLAAGVASVGLLTWLDGWNVVEFGYLHVATAAGLVVPVFLTQHLEKDRRALWSATSALRESDRQHRELAENVEDIFWVCDRRFSEIRYLSPAFETIVGYPREPILSNPAKMLEFIHEGDRESFVSSLRGIGRGRPVEAEYRIVRQDGSLRWIWGRGFPIFDENGRVARMAGTWRDITDRKRIEQTLRESEARFRELAENIQDVFWIWDTSLQVIYVSAAVEELSGVSPEKIREDSTLLVSLMHPDDRRRLVKQLLSMHGGESVEAVGRVLRADGTVRWIEARGWPIRDEGDEVYRFVGIWHDITEQRRAEEEKGALLAVAQDASGTLELDRILERVHRRLIELIPCDSAMTFGWDAEQEKYRPIAEHGARALHGEIMSLEFGRELPLAQRLAAGTLVINDVDDQPWLPPELLRHFGVGAFVATPLKVRGDRAIGASLIFNGRDRPFQPAQIQLLEGIARQLSLAMEAAELYRQQKEDADVSSALSRFGEEIIARAGAADLPDRVCRAGAAVLDCDLCITYLVEEAEDAIVPTTSYGLSQEGWETLRIIHYPLSVLGELIEVMERDGYGDVPVTDAATLLPKPAIQQAANAGITRLVFVPLRHGDRLFGVLGAGYRGRREPFTAAQRQIASGIARIVPFALETARLLRELEQANTVTSHFTATLSHELRNLIAALRGYTFVLRSGGRLGEQDAKTAELAESCARELGELVNQTLDLSRFDARRVPLDLEDVDVTALVEQLSREVGSLASAKSLQIQSSVAEGAKLRTDSLKLKMILRNLLTNAIKFTDRGSITLGALEEDGGLSFVVRDSGVGIPSGALAAIFEPFEQAHGAESRRLGGAGLGLYLVRRLSTILGGEVSVESEVGRGSTFHVWLPRDPENAPAPGSPSALERARRTAALRSRPSVGQETVEARG